MRTFMRLSYACLCVATMAAASRPQAQRAPVSKELERNEDLLYLNPDSGLGQLADQTGGFHITDTNDIKARLQKVGEDMPTYYLVSYSSQNQNYDGSYRKIEIKVKRLGLIVQSRKGYFAINGVFTSPVLAYEVPALALLGKGQRPDAFPVRAAGFNFPEARRTGLAPVMVDASMGDFSFQVDNSKKLYKTDFPIAVLLKDQAGQVVKALAQIPAQLNAPDADGRIQYVAGLPLENIPAGEYELKVIVEDGKTTLTRSGFFTVEK